VPGCTFIATKIEPAPVWMPQPSGPISASGSDLSTTTTLRSDARQCEANDDWPNQRVATSAPLASVAPVVPSRLRPDRLRGMNVAQYAGWPARQLAHSRHESNDSTT